jgi:hypothetical protein
MTDAGARAPAPLSRRIQVRKAPREPLPPPVDPRDPVRKWITYLLIWLLIGIIVTSGAMLIAMVLFRIDCPTDIIFHWMGLALGPVAALVGSTVTFYMGRSRR